MSTDNAQSTGRMQFRCKCGRRYSLPVAAAGRRVKCGCGHVFIVPRAGQAPQHGPALPSSTWVSKGFFLGWWLSAAFVSLIMGLMIFGLPPIDPDFPRVGMALLLIGLPVILFGSVVHLVLVHNMWDAIQSGEARTTPRKAVLYLFIPVFNAYWIYQAFWGWTKDYSELVKRKGLTAPHVPEGLALAAVTLIFPVSILFPFLPLAALLLSLVGQILMAVLLAKACNAVNILVGAQASSPPKLQLLDPGTNPIALGLVGLCMGGVSIVLGHLLGALELRVSAMDSLVLGLFGIGLGGTLTAAGVTHGIVRSVKSKYSAPETGTKKLPALRIIVPTASLVLVVVMLLPTLSAARAEHRTRMSARNVEELCRATLAYASESDWRCPDAEDWPRLIRPYIRSSEEVLASPFAPNRGRAYAMNAMLAGERLGKIPYPSEVVLFFESEFGAPASGGAELLPERPRGPRGYVVGFLDGHAAIVPAEQVRGLLWDGGAVSRP